MNTRASASFLVLSAGLLVGAVGGCRMGDIAGNTVGGFVGGKGGDIARAAVTSAVDYFQQMSTHFSPEQEYYLGRAVAANVVAQHGLDPDEGRQAYVRRIGASLVTLSGRVTGTYGGYHFAVLNSPQPNGMSGPGGFVFVTRGTLDFAKTEDEVAGVLAHEIAHVSLKHGEKVIRGTPEWTAGMAALGRIVGAAGGARGQTAAQISTIFRETAESFAKGLGEHRYGKEFEFKADQEGSLILYDAGYDATSISDYVMRLPARQHADPGMHPGPEERQAALAEIVKTYGGPFDGGVGKSARLARFQALGGKR
jgi:predicted Zn-dependent protease